MFKISVFSSLLALASAVLPAMTTSSVCPAITFSQSVQMVAPDEYIIQFRPSNPNDAFDFVDLHLEAGSVVINKAMVRQGPVFVADVDAHGLNAIPPNQILFSFTYCLKSFSPVDCNTQVFNFLDAMNTERAAQIASYAREAMEATAPLSSCPELGQIQQQNNELQTAMMNAQTQAQTQMNELMQGVNQNQLQMQTQFNKLAQSIVKIAEQFQTNMNMLSQEISQSQAQAQNELNLIAKEQGQIQIQIQNQFNVLTQNQQQIQNNFGSLHQTMQGISACCQQRTAQRIYTPSTFIEGTAVTGGHGLKHGKKHKLGHGGPGPFFNGPGPI